MPKAVRERVLIVGVAPKGLPRGVAEDHLDELERLVDTAGGEVVSPVRQGARAPDPATYIGKGAVDGDRRGRPRERAYLVVFDDELAPGQVRNLEKAWGDGVRVLDRPGPDPRRLRAPRALAGSAHPGRARAAPVPPAAAGRPLRPPLASGRRDRGPAAPASRSSSSTAGASATAWPGCVATSRRSRSPGSCGAAAGGVTGRSRSRATRTPARRRSSTGSRATRRMPPTASSRRSTPAPGGRRRPSCPRSSSSTPSGSSASCRPRSSPRFVRRSPRSGTRTSCSTCGRVLAAGRRGVARRGRDLRGARRLRRQGAARRPTRPMPAGSGAAGPAASASRPMTGEGIPAPRGRDPPPSLTGRRRVPRPHSLHQPRRHRRRPRHFPRPRRAGPGRRPLHAPVGGTPLSQADLARFVDGAH